ncbi:MAG: hypothetical protein IH899_00510 [Planctomycetes bacterium]|nr:hypothetical protein [Planctomycetota bacterium]
MTDVLIYWRDYRKNMRDDRVHGWYSNAKLIGDLLPGDRLWMVTSGKCLRQEAEQAGFLVAVWQVEQVADNPGDDPAYPANEYKYRVIADEVESLNLDEPVLVDHILRPAGRDKAVSIGRFLQGPRKLSDEKVRLMRAAAGPQMAQKWLTGTMKDTVTTAEENNQ